MISLKQAIDRTNGTLCNVATSVETTFHYLTDNSSECKKDSLFVAIRGAKVDGHYYVQDAFAKGASFCVVESQECLGGKPGIVVPDTKKALSQLAGLFYGDPSKELCVIGVTGTNGKTTTQWMIYHLLSLSGVPTLRIGTIGIEGPGISSDRGLTTPDPIYLHNLLREAIGKGITHVVMEASSHALFLQRVTDVSFDVGVFTNLTRDHLDFHPSMEDYAAAKAKLFEISQTAVVNKTAPWGEWFYKNALTRSNTVHSFGKNSGDLSFSDFSEKIGGSTFQLHSSAHTYQIQSPFIGEYNAENLVGAILALVAIGISLEKILPLIQKIPQVPGRLESVGDRGVGVYVDYAHTPDALENALQALRPIKLL